MIEERQGHRESPLGETDAAAASPPGESEETRRESEEKFWQWVALVVLLGCWLAEAQM